MELEEFSSPVQLNINHKQACFTASDETHNWHEETTFNAIIIAGIKQRMMWPPFQTATTETRRPMCKSTDNEIGFTQGNFPWTDERSKYDGTVSAPSTLTCADCQFRVNPRHYKQEGLPVCESNYKLVLLDNEGKLVIMSATGAAKRVMAHYAEWFKNQKMPTFCYVTKFELNAVKNNGNRWADLEVTKAAPTDRAKWVSEYLPLFKQWKGELETPPSVSTGPARTELTTLDIM